MSTNLEKENGDVGRQWRVVPLKNSSSLMKDWCDCLSNIDTAEYLAARYVQTVVGCDMPLDLLACAFLDMIKKGYTHQELLCCEDAEVRRISKAIKEHLGVVEAVLPNCRKE